MRRKKKKVKHHRRRKVGAIHPVMKTALEAVGGAVAGGVLATFANQAIKTSFPSMPSWIGGGVCVAAGAALPFFVKGSPLALGFGAGLAGTGAVFAVNETFLSLPGVSGVPIMPGNPGYINQTVGRVPPRRVGNLSGNRQAVIAGIFDN
jgi:hypothetical protein